MRGYHLKIKTFVPEDSDLQVLLSTFEIICFPLSAVASTKWPDEDELI